MNIKSELRKLPQSEVEFEGELSLEDFKKYEQKSIERISKEIEMPGFRKGKVPEDILRTKISPMMLLEDMSERAMYDVYPALLEEYKVDAIGRPEIMITKLAPETALGFKIKTAILPEVKLPDYKALAKENKIEESAEVTEEEIEKTILELLKMKTKEGEDAPEFNDEFAKSFGNFESAEAFKEKIKENLKLEKEQASKEKKRVKIIEALIEKTEVEVPKILIDAELEKIFARLESDLANMDITLDKYLEQIKKTKDDLKGDWETDAAKRAKLELTLHAISEKENLKPTDEEIDKEVAHVLEHYKGADANRARAYVYEILTNEKVFAMLENQE